MWKELPGPEASNTSANLNETTSSSQLILNPQNILKNIRLKNLNSLIFARLSINPSRPDPGQREKINIVFYFHASLWYLKRIYESL